MDDLPNVDFNFLATSLALVRFAESSRVLATIARLTSKSPSAGNVGMVWKRLGIAWGYLGPGAAAMSRLRVKVQVR